MDYKEARKNVFDLKCMVILHLQSYIFRKTYSAYLKKPQDDLLANCQMFSMIFDLNTLVEKMEVEKSLIT